MKRFNHRFSTLWIAGLLSLLAACSSMDINTSKAPNAKLANYKSYAWAPAKTQTLSIIDQTVQAEANRELAAKGYQMVPTAQADFLVSYSDGTRNKLNTNPTAGYGSEYFDAANVYETRVGSLTLRFVDPKTHDAIWQGTASEAIGDAGADQEQIAAAVKGILEKYPVA